MSDELSERKIIEALSSVLMPGTDQSIIDAENVSGIVIKDSHVGFTIEINPKDKERVDALRVAAEKAVQPAARCPRRCRREGTAAVPSSN